MNAKKQETEFVQAAQDLSAVTTEALEQLHSAAHEVIAQLQGDLRLPEAARRYPILGHLLTTELVAFHAIAVQAKNNQNK